jgi:hypothetical protein
MTPRLRSLLLLGALSSATCLAHASCGSAYCTLMTDRYAQGSGDPHLGWGVDVRLEAVTQDRLRSGSQDVAADTANDEGAIERRTRNLNLVTTLDYGFNGDWSLSVRVPVVHRDHLHDLEAGGSERWTFTRPGDVQVLARRQFLPGDGSTSYALFGGLKLPTGSTDVRNGDGSRAERALQPGSGTTDLVLGLAARRAVGYADALVGQASLAQALNSDESFKPGRRVEASLGWSHAWSPTLGAVVQLNLQHKARDAGEQAEPENSGSTTLNLSPGVTLGIGRGTLYAYLQLPLLQKVNGLQLVPRHALALGWTHDF